MTRVIAPWISALTAVLLPVALAAEVTVDFDTQMVRVTKADCTRLVKHEPSPDVEFRPGVDVRGQAVAPAELDGSVEIELPSTVRVPIEADLFDRRGIPADRRYQGEVEIGVVEIDLEDGRAIFNGQPLTSEAQAELSARCQEILRDGE